MAVTTQFPLHPDDEQQLLKIRRYLIGYRVTNGWTQQELSQKVNGTDSIAYDLESNPNWQWRLSRLQGWMVPFGLRLKARVMLGGARMSHAIHQDPEVATAYALSLGKDTWLYWQRIYVMSALVVGRKRLRVSSMEMARRAGVTRKAITNWECIADDMMLPKVLHYARLLGGGIELGWEEEDG